MDELLCLMFVGHDDRTADALHQRQRRRHIYVVYGPTHGRYARFAMLAMFEASTAEVRALLISSHNFGGFGSVTFEACLVAKKEAIFGGLYLVDISVCRPNINQILPLQQEDKISPHRTNRYSRYDRYYANTVSTMASSGFGPYHGQWHVGPPTKCIGAIPTLWVMMIALGLV